eukprot:3877923-Lingulodinium_polyedra.AAC.1
MRSMSSSRSSSQKRRVGDGVRREASPLEPLLGVLAPAQHHAQLGPLVVAQRAAAACPEELRRREIVDAPLAVVDAADVVP